jgi:hypothetical protein
VFTVKAFSLFFKKPAGLDRLLNETPPSKWLSMPATFPRFSGKELIFSDYFALQ